MEVEETSNIAGYCVSFSYNLNSLPIGRMVCRFHGEMFSAG